MTAGSQNALAERYVARLDEARLSKLLAERAAAQAKVADCDRKLAELCRRWSADNGYRVNLTPEQMKRELEYRARHGEEG